MSWRSSPVAVQSCATGRFKQTNNTGGGKMAAPPNLTKLLFCCPPALPTPPPLPPPPYSSSSSSSSSPTPFCCSHSERAARAPKQISARRHLAGNATQRNAPEAAGSRGRASGGDAMPLPSRGGPGWACERRAPKEEDQCGGALQHTPRTHPIMFPNSGVDCWTMTWQRFAQSCGQFGATMGTNM